MNTLTAAELELTVQWLWVMCCSTGPHTLSTLLQLPIYTRVWWKTLYFPRINLKLPHNCPWVWITNAFNIGADFIRVVDFLEIPVQNSTWRCLLPYINPIKPLTVFNDSFVDLLIKKLSQINMTNAPNVISEC